MRVVLVLVLLELVEPFFLDREGAEAEADAEAEAGSNPSATSSSSNENAFDSIFFSCSSLQSPFFDTSQLTVTPC